MENLIKFLIVTVACFLVSLLIGWATWPGVSLPVFLIMVVCILQPYSRALH